MDAAQRREHSLTQTSRSPELTIHTLCKPLQVSAERAGLRGVTLSGQGGVGG